MMRSRRQHGFTMLEVLLAMGIFVIGFAMVATIFPSAILLQKRTIEDVQGQQASRNAEASIRARKFDKSDLIADMPATTWDTDESVHPLPTIYLDAAYSAGKSEWMLADRSYPVKRSEATQRKFYWVPLLRDSVATPLNYSLNFYVFILKRRQTDRYSRTLPADGVQWANYSDGYIDELPAGPSALDYWTVPGILQMSVGVSGNQLTFNNNMSDDDNPSDLDGVPDYLKENDLIMDNNGIVYRVAAADFGWIEVEGFLTNASSITHIWFSPPGDPSQPSPTVDIFSLTETEVTVP